MDKEKIIVFFKKWWYIPVIVILLLILLIEGGVNNSVEKQNKKEIEVLHKENKKLKSSLVEIRDSIEILHKLALEAKYRDTIYINKIEYLKIKTNEEISNFHNLSVDSQYSVFSKYIEEYETGFTKN